MWNVHLIVDRSRCRRIWMRERRVRSSSWSLQRRAVHSQGLGSPRVALRDLHNMCGCLGYSGLRTPQRSAPKPSPSSDAARSPPSSALRRVAAIPTRLKALYLSFFPAEVQLAPEGASNVVWRSLVAKTRADSPALSLALQVPLGKNESLARPGKQKRKIEFLQ